MLFLITHIKMVSKPSSSAFEGVKMLKWNCLPGRIKKSWHRKIVVLVVGWDGVGKVQVWNRSWKISTTRRTSTHVTIRRKLIGWMIKDSHISYETRQRFFGQGKLKSKNFRGQVKLSDSEIYYTTYIISSSFAQILNTLTLIFRTKAMKIWQL